MQQQTPQVQEDGLADNEPRLQDGIVDRIARIRGPATLPGTVLMYELEDREISQKDFVLMIGMTI